MNLTPSDRKQKVIVPKGTVRENETAVIEIPIELQNEPVVVVKAKTLTAAKSCPGGANLGLMHTYHMHPNDTDTNLGLLNESHMNSNFNNFSSVRHSPSCGNHPCLSSISNQTNPTPKSYKKVTKTIITTTPIDNDELDTSCSTNLSHRTPSRVYKKVVTTTITEGPDGQVTTTTTTSNNEESSVIDPNLTEKTSKSDQNDNNKPKETNVAKNKKIITDDLSGHHVDAISSTSSQTNESRVNQTQNLKNSTINNSGTNIEDDSLEVQKPDERDKQKEITKEDNVEIPKPEEEKGPLATSTPRSSKDNGSKGNKSKKATFTHQDCSTPKKEIRSFKKIVKKTTVTRSATNDYLGVFNPNQMQSGFQTCSDEHSSILEATPCSYIGQMYTCNDFSPDSLDITCSRNTEFTPQYSNDNAGGVTYIKSRPRTNVDESNLSSFIPCAESTKMNFGVTQMQSPQQRVTYTKLQSYTDRNQSNLSSFIPCAESTKISLGESQAPCAQGTIYTKPQPCTEMNQSYLSSFIPCAESTKISLGELQAPCAQGTTYTKSQPCADMNQSNLKSFIPCAESTKMNFGVTQIQPAPCIEINQINNATYQKNLVQASQENYSPPHGACGTIHNVFKVTHSTPNDNEITTQNTLTQSSNLCSPCNENKQSSLGVVHSGQISSGFISKANVTKTGTTQAAETICSFGPCIQSVNPEPCNNNRTTTINRDAFIPCADSNRICLANYNQNRQNSNITTQNSMGISQSSQMDTNMSNENNNQDIFGLMRGLVQPNQTSNTTGGTEQSSFGIPQANQMDSTYDTSMGNASNEQDILGLMQGLVQPKEMNSTFNTTDGGGTEPSSFEKTQPTQIDSTFDTSKSNENNDQDIFGLMQGLVQPNQTSNTTGGTEQSSFEIPQANQMDSTYDTSMGNASNEQDILGLMQGLVQPKETNSAFNTTDGGGSTEQSSIPKTQNTQINPTYNISTRGGVQNDLIQPTQSAKEFQQILKEMQNVQDKLEFMKSALMNSTFNIENATNQDRSKVVVPNKVPSKELEIQQAMQDRSNLQTTRSSQYCCGQPVLENSILLNQTYTPIHKNIFKSSNNNQSTSESLGLLQPSEMSHAQINLGTMHSLCGTLGQSSFGMQGTQLNSDLGPNINNATYIPTNALNRAKPTYRKITKTTRVTKRLNENGSLELIPTNGVTNTSASYISNSSSKQPAYRKIIKTTTITKTPVDYRTVTLPNTPGTNMTNLSLLQSSQINSTSGETSGLLSSSGCNSECASHLTGKENISNYCDINESTSRSYQREDPHNSHLATQLAYSDNTLGLLHSPHLNTTDYINNPAYFQKNINNQMRTTLSSPKSGRSNDYVGAFPPNYLTRSDTTDRNIQLQQTFETPAKQFKYFSNKRNNYPICINSSAKSESLALASCNLSNIDCNTKSPQDQILDIHSSTPVLKNLKEKEFLQLSQSIQNQLKKAETIEHIKLQNDLKRFQETRRQLVANASRVASLNENTK